MKRTIAFLLVLVMLCSLCGCTPRKVKECINAIDEIGAISTYSRDESHTRYKNALDMYNTLTDKQKNQVSNAELLVQKTAEFQKAQEIIAEKEKREKAEREQREFEKKAEEYVLEQVQKTLKELVDTPSSFKLRTDKSSYALVGSGCTPQSSEVTGYYSIYFSTTNYYGGTVDDEITFDTFTFKNENGRFSDFEHGASFDLWILQRMMSRIK